AATTVSMSLCPSNSATARRSVALSSTISRRLRRGTTNCFRRPSACSRPSRVVGLVTNANAPRASACWRSSSIVSTWTGMWRGTGRCRPGVAQRQVQRQSAARAGRAAQPDLPAKQIRELAADCEPQARAAIAPAGARVGLLEGFEHDLLFLRRDADAGVGYFE